MYKWQANTLARSSLSHDLAIVRDGIAATTRQFSLSSRRLANDDDDPPSRAIPPRMTLAQRQAAAMSQVQATLSQAVSSRSSPGQTGKPNLLKRTGTVNREAFGAARARVQGAVDATTFRARLGPGQGPTGAGAGPANLLRPSAAALGGLRGRLRGRGGMGGVRGGGGRGAARGGRGGGGQDGDRRRRMRMNQDDDDEDGDLTPEEAAEWGVRDISDQGPQEDVVYEPAPISMQDLRKDWPSIPTSSDLAMAESVDEKLTWLARRTGMEYVAPDELATRLFEGEIVQFETEEEKTVGLELARQMAVRKTWRTAKRKNREYFAEKAENMSILEKPDDPDDEPDEPDLFDMEMDLRKMKIRPEEVVFEPIAQAEKKEVMDAFTKGDYAPLQRQRVPLLDNVVRNLRNNETYQGPESVKFMAKLESLIPGRQTANMTNVEGRK